MKKHIIVSLLSMLVYSQSYASDEGAGRKHRQSESSDDNRRQRLSSSSTSESESEISQSSESQVEYSPETQQAFKQVQQAFEAFVDIVLNGDQEMSILNEHGITTDDFNEDITNPFNQNILMPDDNSWNMIAWWLNELDQLLNELDEEDSQDRSVIRAVKQLQRVIQQLEHSILNDVGQQEESESSSGSDEAARDLSGHETSDDSLGDSDDE